jgi:hypothetical protein
VGTLASHSRSFKQEQPGLSQNLTGVHLLQNFQQLVIYHSVLLVYKVMKTESPAYLFSMFNTKYQYRTRQADSGVIKQMFCPKLTLTSHSFRFQAASHFNGLPSTIRNAETLPSFKQMVKKWINENETPS